MTDPITAIRLKTSIRVVLARETAIATGTDLYFKLQGAPIIEPPPVQVRVNNILKLVTTDYTVDAINGVVAFVAAPAVNDQIDFIYYWSIYSDDELQYFIDAANSNLVIASAQIFLALAADSARLAKRQTLIGGGGIGQATIDTSVASKELRALAKDLLDNEALIADLTPAEGLTEVPWTQAELEEQIIQSLIRSA